MERELYVRALMAQFHKLATQQKVSAGSSLQGKMAALEKNLSGRKMTPSNSSPTSKPTFQRPFEASPREEVGRSFIKPPPFKPKPAETCGDSESSGSSMPTFPRPPVMKPPVKAAFSNKINVSPASAKPAWMNNSGLESTPTAPKPPNVPKPKSSVSSLQSQLSQESSMPPIPKPSQSINVKPPPPLAQLNYFPKEQRVTPNIGVVKGGLRSLNPITPASHKPSAMQKPNFVARSGTMDQPVSQRESTDPSVPRKRSLPNVFSLGNPPLKPNRPPNVDIHRFRGNGASLNSGPRMKIPCPLAPPSTSQHKSFPPPPPLCKSSTMRQQLDQEESYDDVGVMNPLPILPPKGHPAKKTEAEFNDEEMYEDLDERWTEQLEKSKISQDKKAGKEETKPIKVTEEKQTGEIGDEEMYEDLEERWNEQEHKETDNLMEMKGQEKKMKKEEKKKQLLQENKFQKVKEKREQEAKKKFKIKGPVHVIQDGKARLDSKGGKTDLPLKQGEIIEIIRIIDNPEGRWLARNMEGYYGYVKTESVDIDYDHLKQQMATTGLLPNQTGADPEVYDDVGAQADVCSGLKGQYVGDGDIYDDVDSPDQEMRFPPPPPPPITVGDEVYDEVESQSSPPPPPLNGPLQLTSKGKPEVLDPRKLKTFEKEEKEFRKKFKFEGEIQVLYDVMIASTLSTKKWGNKDLQLKPGEVIDVIVKPIDGKLIGRNREGKLGYVEMVNVAQDTRDIYDDIGEDCIYDND